LAAAGATKIDAYLQQQGESDIAIVPMQLVHSA
jgi:hypothetical protein